LEGESQRSARVSLGDYIMTIARAGAENAERVAAMFLQNGPDEFIITGSGNMNVSFNSVKSGASMTGIESVDEGDYVNGQWVPGRRLNGDENAQGQLLKLNTTTNRSNTIYRVRLYHYQ